MSFDQGRFLDVAIHGDELTRLRRSKQRTRSSSRPKGSLLSIATGAVFSPGGNTEFDPGSQLTAERNALAAGIGEHVASKPEIFSRFCRSFGIDPEGKNRKKQLLEHIWCGSSGEGARDAKPDTLRLACDTAAEIVLFVIQEEAKARAAASPPQSPYGSFEEVGPTAGPGNPWTPGTSPPPVLNSFMGGPEQLLSASSFANERNNERVRYDLLYAVRAGLDSLAVEHERKAALHAELYEAQCTIMALQRQVEAMREIAMSPQGTRYAASDSSGEDVPDSPSDTPELRGRASPQPPHIDGGRSQAFSL